MYHMVHSLKRTYIRRLVVQCCHLVPNSTGLNTSISEEKTGEKKTYLHLNVLTVDFPCFKHILYHSI